MGGLKLEEVASSVNKKIQVEMKHKQKHKDKKDKKEKHTPQHQEIVKHNKEKHHKEHHKENKEKDKRHREKCERNLSLLNINSTDESFQEEYDRMFLKSKQQDGTVIRKCNSDISDFITIMAMEENQYQKHAPCQPSDGDEISRRLRVSESDSKSIYDKLTKTRKDHSSVCLNKDCGTVCMCNGVNEILRQDMRKWEQKCACANKRPYEGAKSAWENDNVVYSCDKTCDSKKSKEKKPPKKNKRDQSPNCPCSSQNQSSRRRSSRSSSGSRITAKNTNSKVDTSCTPCGKCCSGSKVQVYQQESDIGNRRDTGGNAEGNCGCAADVCPPCQLCQQGCAALKLSPSEERIALEREMVRCDCKRKLLKLRLMKAFNVCAKCRQPRSKCHCLEEIIRDYRQREMEREMSLKNQQGRDCSCQSEDPFAKLIQEVTNTCPKCGHGRMECTCLEEMITDVKRILIKKHPEHNGNPSGGANKTCTCIGDGAQGQRKRSSVQNRENFNNPNPNVGNVSCSKCQIFVDVEDEGNLDDDSRLRCSTKNQTVFNVDEIERSDGSFKRRGSTHELTSQYSRLDTSHESCPLCKKPISSCKCKISVCPDCKIPDILCSCDNPKNKYKERKRGGKQISARAEMTETFCECDVEAVDENGRLIMCEECLKPKIHCLCMQSPTCFKCGKHKDEDAERHGHFTKTCGSERPRSSTRHRYSESVKTVPNMNTRYDRSPVNCTNSNSKFTKKGHRQVYQTSVENEQSPIQKSVGTRHSPVALKNKTCEERYSQSAFQKLKSHFIRCSSCGKKHTKKQRDSTETQCEYNNNISKDTKEKGKMATGPVDVLLPPKGSQSLESLHDFNHKGK